MSYCGKNCDRCYQRGELECPGCEAGPGKPVFGTCKISMCCRGKQYENCGQCADAPQCHKLSECGMAPVTRLQQRQESARNEYTMNRFGPTMARCFRLIFWMEVVMLAGAGVLEAAGWFPSLSLLGVLIQNGAAIAGGIILIRLGSVCSRLKTAGCFVLISGASILLANLLLGILPLLALLLLLDGMILSFLGAYQELNGYAEVMQGVDVARADAWRMLWKWYLIVHIVLYVSELLLFLLPVAASVAYMLAVMAQMVITVLKLVYLRRSAEYFPYR